MDRDLPYQLQVEVYELMSDPSYPSKIINVEGAKFLGTDDTGESVMKFRFNCTMEVCVAYTVDYENKINYKRIDDVEVLVKS